MSFSKTQLEFYKRKVEELERNLTLDEYYNNIVYFSKPFNDLYIFLKDNDQLEILENIPCKITFALDTTGFYIENVIPQTQDLFNYPVAYQKHTEYHHLLKELDIYLKQENKLSLDVVLGRMLRELTVKDFDVQS